VTARRRLLCIGHSSDHAIGIAPETVAKVRRGIEAAALSNDIRNPTAGDIENPATPVTLTLRPEPVPCWP
jgi:hypothetical protein